MAIDLNNYLAQNVKPCHAMFAKSTEPQAFRANQITVICLNAKDDLPFSSLFE